MISTLPQPSTAFLLGAMVVILGDKPNPGVGMVLIGLGLLMRGQERIFRVGSEEENP